MACTMLTFFSGYPNTLNQDVDDILLRRFLNYKSLKLYTGSGIQRQNEYSDKKE